jgi:hypothetical protein
MKQSDIYLLCDMSLLTVRMSGDGGSSFCLLLLLACIAISLQVGLWFIGVESVTGSRMTMMRD